MRSPRPVALLLLVLLLSACDGLSVDEGGPQTPNTCVIKADEPHLSSTARRRGYDSMIVKDWFICSTALQDGTLELEVQRRIGDDWELFSARPPQTFEPVPVRIRKESVHEVSCAEGTFRTRTRLSTHDQDGTPRESQWFFSRLRTDPCGAS